MMRLLSLGRGALTVVATGLLGSLLLGFGLLFTLAWATAVGATSCAGSLVVGQWLQHRALVTRSDAARLDLQVSTRRAVALMRQNSIEIAGQLADRDSVAQLSASVDRVNIDPDRGRPHSQRASGSRREGDEARSLERLMMLLVLSARSGARHD